MEMVRMAKPLISVIVPVYNAEQFLPDCLDSILAQTYSIFECFLVDDGSIDNSGAICDRYGARDSRFHVLHTENKGVSHARNLGLDRIQGQYVAFVDADDCIHPRCLEVLLNGLLQTGAQMSVGGFLRYTREPAFGMVEAGWETITGQEAMAALNDWRNLRTASLIMPCGRLFLRELLADIRFPEGVRHEDEFVAHLLAERCSCIAMCDAPLYGYRENPGSYMGSGMDFAHLVLMDALSDRIAFFSEKAPDLVSGAVHHLLRECNSFYDEYSKHSGTAYRENRARLVKLYRRQYLRYWHRLSWTERGKGGLFAFCPRLYHAMAERKWKRMET